MKTTMSQGPLPALVSLTLLIGGCGDGDDRKKDRVEPEGGVQQLRREAPEADRAPEAGGTERVALTPEEIRVREQIRLLRQRLSESQDDPDAMAEQIGRIGELGERGKELLPEVVKATSHEDPFVRGLALHAVASVDPGGSRGILEKALGDEDPEVREAAVQAWRTAGITDLQPLLSRVDDEFDPKVQFAILHVAAETGDATHVPAVVEVVDSLMPNALKPAVRFLAEKGGAAQAERIAGFIERDDMDLRVLVSRSLEQLGDRSKPVLMALATTLTDDEAPVRMAGFQALKALTGQDLGYDPDGPEEARRNAAKAFRDWISRN